MYDICIIKFSVIEGDPLHLHTKNTLNILGASLFTRKVVCHSCFLDPLLKFDLWFLFHYGIVFQNLKHT